MRILIVANHYAVCSARYAADAFTRLGHDVRHIGPAMGRNIWGMTLPERYVWEPDGSVTDHVDWANFVLVMDSDSEILDGSAYASNRGKTVAVFGADNHVRDYRRPWFDHYFLAHRNVSAMPWVGEQKGLVGTMTLATATWTGLYKDMAHMPCCYDSTVFTPSTIPWAEREYDVAMIGVMYEARWRAVQELRAAGLKVLAGTGLVYENAACAYQNARISLCLSSNGDVGQRVFETAATGCLVLSDDCPDYALLRPDGLAIWDGDDLVGTVRDLLSDAGRASEMIARSQAWAAPHTWDARAQVIVDWVTHHAA